jgi:hypothetical protein
MGSCTARLTGMNPSTQIHPVILSWIADNWDIEIGSDQDSIECYMEMKVKEGPTYCAHPNYCNEVPWQDWANVSFVHNQQGVFWMVPSRILLFYIYHLVDDNGEHSNEIRALVQTCDYQVGSDHARQLRMEETHLCCCWQPVIHEVWVITRWGQSKRTQTILSVSKGPQKSSFSSWRESGTMWVMARKVICLVGKGQADRVVTYVSITWWLGTSRKPSDLQQFSWHEWLKVFQVTAVIVDYSWLIWYKEDRLNTSKSGSPPFETLTIWSSPRNDTMPTNDGSITDFSKWAVLYMCANRQQ